MSQLNGHRRARFFEKGDGPRLGGCARAIGNPASGGCAGAGRTVYRGLAPDIMTCERRDDNSEIQHSLSFLAICLRTPDSSC